MTENPFDAPRIIATATQRLERDGEPIIALWALVPSGRAEFRECLMRDRGALPLVPLLVRGGFDNPNSLLDDLMALLESSREDVSDVTNRAGWSGRLILVLIARGELQVVQAASPARLPSWLPRIGGTTQLVAIEDMLSRAMAPLNAPECRIDEIARGLYELDVQLSRRIGYVWKLDQRRFTAFWDLSRDRGASHKPAETVEQFLPFLAAIRNPAAYRSSAREGRSVVGRIMRIVSTTAPESMSAAADAIARALGLDLAPEFDLRDSLVAVLTRPSARDPDPLRGKARNLLVSVYAAAQLTTGAAHAADYPAYPAVLLRGISYDLRDTLDSAARQLQLLPSA